MTYESFFSDRRPVPASLLLLVGLVVHSSLAVAANATDSVMYRSDFARDLSGFRRIFHYHGKVNLAVDGARPGLNGKPSLRVALSGETKTIVGRQLPVASGQRLRVSLSAAVELQVRGHIRVVLKCVDAGGKQLAWVDLGELPSEAEFGRLRSSTAEISKGTDRAYLVVFIDGVRGTLWLADVVVEQMGRMPAELEQLMHASARTVWGINDPLSLAYHAPHDDMISDTSAKLMAAAGFTHARLWCWWGSRDQLKRDINQGGAWVTADRGEAGWDFSKLQARIDRLAHYGLSPGAVVVHGTPEWASGKTAETLPAEVRAHWRMGRRPFFAPRDWADYEEFVRALVASFRDRVHVWEVMNEPNTSDAGLQGGHRAYMDYLRHFYRAAKSIDGECTVLCSRVGSDWLGKMIEVITICRTSKVAGRSLPVGLAVINGEGNTVTMVDLRCEPTTERGGVE